jgi:hypothetical protein
MSERNEPTDFGKVIFTDPEMHADYAQETVALLQRALCAFDEPLNWPSSDRRSFYFAEPSQFKEGSDEPVPYGRLRDMTLAGLSRTMQTWRLRKVTIRPEQNEVLQENFIIHPGRALVTSAIGSMAVFEEDVQGNFARNALQDELRNIAANTKPASVRDYANLDNALFDLEPRVEQAWKDYEEYLDNMTPADMRNHRAMKRDWIIAPEQDKTAAAKYWGITVGGQVWLVKAGSAEEAVLDLEDHFEMGLEPLFMSFTDPYNDEVQAELSDKYADGGIHRLIPYSLVEWPKDTNNMTNEQRAAFDKLR